MAYQRGSLRKVSRRNGLTWGLRYRAPKPDGRRVDTLMTIGLVKDFPTKDAARREVDRLGLLCSINSKEVEHQRLKLKTLAEHYLDADLGLDAIRPKSDTTIAAVQHYVRDWIVPQWGDLFADAVKPIDIQRWLKSLHTDSHLAWTTISKIRGIFARMYKVGMLHELVEKNPLEHVQTRQTTSYRAIMLTPEQTLRILDSQPNILHYALVLTCAATALRASEILALRWADVLWAEGRIRVSKRWALGREGSTKTKASDGYVPMHPVLAQHLKHWRSLSPYWREEDFVFPSLSKNGKVPICASVFVRCYLRPAAKEAGVAISAGHRFGLHNLRHSLSNWLVNVAKTEPKTVQGLLRHSKVQTTLDLYTQSDRNETRIAQGRFLQAMGLVETIQ